MKVCGDLGIDGGGRGWNFWLKKQEKNYHCGKPYKQIEQVQCPYSWALRKTK
jgi:hypothetical protein